MISCGIFESLLFKNETRRSSYTRNLTPSDGWLFPGQHYLKPICYRQVHRIAAEAARAAGITKRVGPHTLRHSFATHMLEDGVDVRIIQTLLGHAKLETTALYTRVATRTVKNVVSPLDKLGIIPGSQAAPDG